MCYANFPVSKELYSAAKKKTGLGTRIAFYGINGLHLKPP